MEKLIVCPGCGAAINSNSSALDKAFNASACCRSLYFELSYFTISLGDTYFIHQLIVDAYAAQHLSNRVKPITAAFALVGLYLVWERGYSGKEVQNMHTELARGSKVWPQFQIPKEKEWLTVQEVSQSPEDEKEEMIKSWSKSVWEVWKTEKDSIAKLLYQHLEVWNLFKYQHFTFSNTDPNLNADFSNKSAILSH